MSIRKLYVFREVTELLPVDETFILHCVEAEWIQPVARTSLDEADVARLRLIIDLKQSFGVNDEGIPVILHLMDQLHTLHARLRGPGRDPTAE